MQSLGVKRGSHLRVVRLDCNLAALSAVDACVLIHTKASQESPKDLRKFSPQRIRRFDGPMRRNGVKGDGLKQRIRVIIGMESL